MTRRWAFAVVAAGVLACFGIAIALNANHGGNTVVLLCITAVDTAVGYNIGAARGRPALGLVLGFLLSIGRRDGLDPRLVVPHRGLVLPVWHSAGAVAAAPPSRAQRAAADAAAPRDAVGHPRLAPGGPPRPLRGPRRQARRLRVTSKLRTTRGQGVLPAGVVIEVISLGNTGGRGAPTAATASPECGCSCPIRRIGLDMVATVTCSGVRNHRAGLQEAYC